MREAAISKLRNDIREIFEAGIRAADPAEAVVRACQWHAAEERLDIQGSSYSLAGKRILAAGIGKASCPMAAALERLLGARIERGLVVTKDGCGQPLRRCEVREASHPVPDERGVKAGEELLRLAADAGENDVVIFLVSGGGSALTTLPPEGIPLADMRVLTETLLRSGAAIREVNAVRKHLSRLQGGKFARAAYPASLITLVLSDVVGDELDVIASGPAVPDESTFADCMAILEKYHRGNAIPPSVRAWLEAGVRGSVEETPKRGDPAFERVATHIVGSSMTSLRAAKEAAERRGYHTMILASSLTGESREVAAVHAAVVRELRRSGNPIAPPACIVAGGETTVTVRGTGLGGRNMEFALAAAIGIDGVEHAAVLSGATDGTDGPTGAAGAIVDGTTIERAKECGLDAAMFLARNDSYHFFQLTGDLLVTGPTRTNVMDLIILLVA